MYIIVSQFDRPDWQTQDGMSVLLRSLRRKLVAVILTDMALNVIVQKVTKNNFFKHLSYQNKFKAF